MRLLLWTLLALVPSANAAVIVHSNDVLGEIEPCGCRSNPLGGMARKANFLKRLPDQQILDLDAGDLLFPSDSLPEILKQQSEVQAGFLIESMNMTHHDAVVPGEKDFALGYKVFEKLRKKAKFAFLAANLKLRSGGSPFKAEQIFERKEKSKTLRIGVFGIVGDELSWPKELKASSPIAAAKAEVQKLRKKVDFVVALTHQSYEKDQELASKVSGIDFIIGGHSQTFLQDPYVVGKTEIFESSFRNQYVGVIPLTKPSNPENYKLIGLDAGYDSPAEAPSAMDDLVKRFKLAIAELNSKQEAKIEKTTVHESTKGPKFQTFPKCAECHLKQFDFWRKTQHETALSPLVRQKQALNKECLMCHTVGLGDPKGFSNVAHLAAIKKAGNDDSGDDDTTAPVETDDLNRLLQDVHTVGLKDKVKLTAAEPEGRPLIQALHSLDHSWTPVQCENCHTPGGDHPFSNGYSKKVENKVCLSCHTAERAPEWYDDKGHLKTEVLESKRRLVTCPAGDLDADTGD